MYFLRHPLEKIQFHELLGLTISTDQEAKLASKASCRMGILRRLKPFLAKSELLTVHKDFAHSSMVHCSSLRAGAPASHPSLRDSVASIAFDIIQITHYEAGTQGLLLSHRRKVGEICVFYCLFSNIALSALCPPILPIYSRLHAFFQSKVKRRIIQIKTSKNHEG